MVTPLVASTRPDARAPLSPWSILTFVCAGQFMVFIDVSIVNLALPSIQSSLHMSDVSLNYVVTAYGTVLGGFLMLGGPSPTPTGAAAPCKRASWSSPRRRCSRASRRTARC